MRKQVKKHIKSGKEEKLDEENVFNNKPRGVFDKRNKTEEHLKIEEKRFDRMSDTCMIENGDNAEERK
jgi:hypothetical protein